MANKKKLIVIMCILAGICLIFTAIYVYVDSIQDKKDYKNNLSSMVSQIYSFDTLDIDTLSLTNPDGEFVFKRVTDNNTWTMESSPTDFVFSDYTLNMLASYLSTLTSTGTITENAEDLSAYKLDSPYKAEAKTLDGKTYTVLVGDISTTNDFYYATTPNSKIIYKLSTTLGAAFSTSLDKLKNTYIMDVSESQIDYVKLVRDDAVVFEIQSSDNYFDFLAPVKWRIDDTEVSNVVNALIRSSALQIVEKGDGVFEKYGFDDPFAILTVKAKNGNERTVYFTKYNSVTLNIYGFYDDMVLEFYTGDVSYLWENTYEMLNPAVYGEKSMSDISEFAFDYDGYNVVMSFAPNKTDPNILDVGWKYKKVDDTEYTEIPIQTVEQRADVYALYTALFSIDWEDIDLEPKLDG
ncbi:MAG: DUF4340 domain-containing protein, partial [Oscillospiraceae bacterium]|nr:DUF4340 domain-containing protein [Oscillospiraceae bacterium]